MEPQNMQTNFSTNTLKSEKLFFPVGKWSGSPSLDWSAEGFVTDSFVCLIIGAKSFPGECLLSAMADSYMDLLINSAIGLPDRRTNLVGISSGHSGVKMQIIKDIICYSILMNKSE